MVSAIVPSKPFQRGILVILLLQLIIERTGGPVNRLLERLVPARNGQLIAAHLFALSGESKGRDYSLPGFASRSATHSRAPIAVFCSSTHSHRLAIRK